MKYWTPRTRSFQGFSSCFQSILTRRDEWMGDHGGAGSPWPACDIDIEWGHNGIFRFQSSFLLISSVCGLENLAFFSEASMPVNSPRSDGSEWNAHKLGLSIVVSFLSLSLYSFEWLVLQSESHWVLDSQPWHMAPRSWGAPAVPGDLSKYHQYHHSKATRLPSFPCPYRKWSNGSWLPPLTRYLRPALPVAGGP